MAGSTALTWLKWSSLALAVSSVLLALMLMLTAKHSLQTIVDAVALQSGASIVNPDITEYEGDRLVWRLQAKEAVEEGNVIKLTRPDIELYDKKQQKIPIEAQHGLLNKQAKTMHLQGKVKMQLQDWTLTSATLDIDEGNDEVHVRSAFVLQGDGLRMTGNKMSISRTTGTMKAWGGVQMLMEQGQ